MLLREKEDALHAVQADSRIAVGMTTGTSAPPSSAILTSIGGGPWTLQDTPTSTELYDVAFGAGSFVAVGARGTILYSGQFAKPGCKPPMSRNDPCR